MKKSAMVPTTFLMAFAASFVAGGCQSGKRCEDANGRLLRDEDCKRGVGGARYVPYGGFGGTANRGSSGVIGG